MSTMILCVTNSTFQSRSENDEFTSIDEAFRSVVLSGLDIAGGEVANGAKSSIVTVEVEAADGRCLARGAVSVATQQLLVPDERA